MTRPTALQAWDWLQDDLQRITRLGWNVAAYTQAEQDLHAALADLNQQRLPITAIYQLGAAIAAAYAIGAERAKE